MTSRFDKVQDMIIYSDMIGAVVVVVSGTLFM